MWLLHESRSFSILSHLLLSFPFFDLFVHININLLRTLSTIYLAYKTALLFSKFLRSLFNSPPALFRSDTLLHYECLNLDFLCFELCRYYAVLLILFVIYSPLVLFDHGSRAMRAEQPFNHAVSWTSSMRNGNVSCFYQRGILPSLALSLRWMFPSSATQSADPSGWPRYVRPQPLNKARELIPS